jgi:phytoene dehydrogenase-like protein
MAKSIIIIGSGLGGLSAGVYGQLNGFTTRIYELGSQPGGQCASWQRKGYTFDVWVVRLFYSHTVRRIFSDR